MAEAIDSYELGPQYIIHFTNNDTCVWSESKLLTVINEGYKKLKDIIDQIG